MDRLVGLDRDRGADMVGAQPGPVGREERPAPASGAGGAGPAAVCDADRLRVRVRVHLYQGLSCQLGGLSA